MMDDILELVGMAEARRRAEAYPALVAALLEISKGEGPYSRDPLTHASNTIEAMKQLAQDALAALQQEVTA